MPFSRFTYLLSFCLLLNWSCSESPTTPSSQAVVEDAQFRFLDAATTGVTFENRLTEDYDYNILSYEYLYNGGGVAIGDINQDGLPDLYFSATRTSNKLYLNEGNFKFKDITASAGVAALDGFKTGVSMIDINNDGLLDIFACRTSKEDDGKKDNLLFINQGDLTFKEEAAAYGLNDNSNTNHVAFLDYDLDGDLDLYLLNHRIGFKTATQLRLMQTLEGGVIRKMTPMTAFDSDRLYRNDNGTFTDVSAQAGIANAAFGLSVTVSDLNQDGYPDIYVANDYIEPDFIYINQKDGTFKDTYFSTIRHSSQNTMGADIADFNNDGLPDIVTLDMIAEDPIRYKELMNVMQVDRYAMLEKYGYGHQAGRNMLQVNNGNGTFSELGQLAGVATTDWSWGALLADFDNDGWRDLFITNGYRRDVTNLDYMSYTRDSIERTGGVSNKRFPDINTVLQIIPEKKLGNYLYRNQGNLRFEDKSAAWNIDQPSYSNGTAYGDLDGDGDLDLVVNNILSPAFIYENLSASKGNYLQIQLEGPTQNRAALGTTIDFTTTHGKQYAEAQLNHGFFSVSDNILHFGLGTDASIAELHIQWPDRSHTILKNVTANQRLVVKYEDTERQSTYTAANKSASLFQEIKAANGLNFTHLENDFSDFKREQLIPHKVSTQGPALAVADVNGDQLDDIFIGGAAGQASSLFIQQSTGQFSASSTPAFAEHAVQEDVSSLFFDADGDGDQDLFVVSGGNAFALNASEYLDRLYLNDGRGNFAASALPALPTSGGAVIAFDYDQDGDQDLLVGGRIKPGSYPQAPLSYVLQNNGNAQFEIVTDAVFPAFKEIGMVTDLALGDLDKDGIQEVIISGAFMPLQVFQFNGQTFVNQTEKWGLQASSGLWNTVHLADVDGDGDIDLVTGNEGLNTRLKASEANPLKLYHSDFDNNGAIDPILCFAYQGKYYPFAGRDNLMSQMPHLKKKFPRYRKYANATIEEVIPTAQLQAAQLLEAAHLANTVWIQEEGRFTAQVLENAAQTAPVYGVVQQDFNDDTTPDLLLVGNYSGSHPETGVYDAGNGVLLTQTAGQLTFVENRIHGFWASQEARDVQPVRLARGRNGLVVANNNGNLQLFSY